MVFIEPSFPRGKKPEESEDVPRRKFHKNNYGASTAEDAKGRNPRPKERRQARLEQKTGEEGNGELANNLSFFTLQEGMLVMGCVTFVSRAEVGLTIPGRIKGVVPASSISDAYTKRSQAGGSCDCPDLWHLYKVGDVVYSKVMKKQVPDRHVIELSLNPTDLHSEFDAKKLVPGLVLAATIAAEEDHGFLMETGIRNVFAFLPRANLRDNVADIGRNIFCFIEQVRPVDGKSVRLVLKAFRTTEQRRLNVGEANLDMIVPGCVIPFTVDKVLDHGLRGTLFDDDVPAFVYENMLTTTTSKPSDYSLFKQMDATLLYVLPVTKQVYVSLVHYKKNFIEGQVRDPPTIEKAVTERATLNGVWFRFGNCRAFMPKRMVVQTLGSGENYEDFIKFGKYSIGSEHTLNIVRYDHLDRTFIVSARPDDTEEELKSRDEVRIGKTYRCEVVKSSDANAVEVKLGQVAGLVKGVYLQRGKTLKKGSQMAMKAVEFSTDGTTVLFTNRPKLLGQKVNVLSDWKQLSRASGTDEQFSGIVVDETPKHFVVAFFGGITGLVEKKEDDDDTSAGAASLVGSMRLARGTIARFNVKQYDEGKKQLLLSVPEKMMKVSPGKVTAVTVTSVCPNAVFVETREGEEKGKIPLDYFSVFPQHNAAFVRLLREGQELQAVRLWADVLSVRDVQYAQRSPMFSELVKPGDVLRAISKPHYATACPLLCDYRKNVPLPSEWTSNQFPSREVLMVKVKDIVTTKGTIEFDLSFQPEDVCIGGIESVFSYVVEYFDDVIGLIKRSAEKGVAFAKYNIGQAVSCTVESVVEDKVVVKVCDAEGGNITSGIGTKSKRMTPNAGDKLDGRIVWVDVERQLVHVCIDPKLLPAIGDPAETADSAPEAQFISADQTEPCNVLFRNKYIRICSRKGKSPGPLLVVPVRHHYNELEAWKPQQEDEQSSTIDVVKIRHFGPLVFGMLEEPYKLYSSYAKKSSKKTKTAPQKRKETTEEPDGQERSQENGTEIKAKGKKRLAKPQQDDEEKPKKKKAKPVENLKEEKPANEKVEKKPKFIKNGKKKSDAASNGEAKSLGKKKKRSFAIEQLDGCDDGLFLLQLDGADAQLPSKKKASKRKLDQQPKGIQKAGGLPGATNFWDSTPVYKQPQTDSSDAEEEDSGAEEQRHAAAGAKKRLTAKERFEALKQEEDRLRKIEEELADPSIDPHTPDQFERLVLAQPNNSMLWIRYMVFHMESAELDKARAVARKALKAINFREEAELLNVWVALLNLEIRYETVDSFKEVLQEAIQYSDAFKVYTRVLDILIDCEKNAEVRELLELLQKKFRKQPEMWYLVADAWYRIGQGSKVKPLLSQALKSLPNRDHIALIVKFAFLHNRNANRDEAHLLFEQILTSYPKRTDIWSQYVDMLVKDGLVENARQILERAIMQRLPMKNMKTLYTKYVNFEEKHGDRESVRRVKQKATEYVQTQLNNAGISSISDGSSGQKK